MQVLYLSNRPEVLAVTVESLRTAVAEELEILVITPAPTGIDGVTDLPISRSSRAVARALGMKAVR